MNAERLKDWLSSICFLVSVICVHIGIWSSEATMARWIGTALVWFALSGIFALGFKEEKATEGQSAELKKEGVK